MDPRRRQGQPGRHHPGAGQGRAQQRRAHLRENASDCHRHQRRSRHWGADDRGRDQGRGSGELRRPVGAPGRAHGRRHGAALFLRAHVHRHREDGGRAARPAGDARSRRLHLLQGGGRRPLDGRVRARGQALEQGHHSRRFRVRHAARRLGPVPDPDGQRPDPRPGAGEDRHQDVHERPGELHAGLELHFG